MKHPALDPKYNPRIRHENIDADYLHKLSPEELEWYNKFMEEENNASFKNDDTDLNKTKEEKRKIFHKNNARQRCVYSQAKAGNRVVDNYDNGTGPEEVEEDYENILIDYLDSKKS